MLDLAAAQGYCETIRSLLARGADVNASTPSGRTALHCAAYQDQAAAVDTLIANGACVEAADDQGCTALHVASVNGASGVVASLLRHRADKNKVNNDGRSPLLLAVENGRLAAARTLLHASEDEDEGFVDRRYGGDEYSALDLSVRGGNTEIFEMIVGHGADVNSQDSDGVRALYLAALNDQAVMVDILVNAGADVGARAHGRQNRTALHVACAEGSSRAVQALFMRGASRFMLDSGYRTPLHLAAWNGDVETVKTLLAWGSTPASCSTAHEYKLTALEEASRWGHVGALRAMCDCVVAKTGGADAISSAVSIAAKWNQTRAIDALVEAGGDVNAERRAGGTPIHYAAETGSSDAIAALAWHGADVNDSGGPRYEVYRNKFLGRRRSALHTAAFFGWAKAVEALLVAGANPAYRCHYGDDFLRPIDIASEEGNVEVMRLMIKYGVDVDLADPCKGKTALHVAAEFDKTEAIGVLAEAGCSLGLTDENGLTPLHACAVNTSCAAIAALTVAGADVNAVGAGGVTPLHLASARADRLDAAKALLAAGAETAPRNNENASALDLAAKIGHVALIQALVEAGAQVNDEDTNGQTALMSAVKFKNADAVDALLSAGADVEAHLHGESWTSLHAAVEDTSPDVVQVLLKHGADVHAKDAENDNDTPLHVAVRHDVWVEGAFEIVKALLWHDADEEARNDSGLTPVCVVGSMGGAEAARAVTTLLLRAPGDRAWRRRGLLILCCARAKRTSSAAAAAAIWPKEEQERKRQPSCIEGVVGVAGSIAGEKGEGKECATTRDLGAETPGTDDNFDNVAAWLLELPEEGLFRTVTSFL